MCPRDAGVPERLSIVLDKSGGPDSCWNFTGGVNRSGYGRMQIANTTKSVHVWAYESAFGNIPDGLIVRHKCDNRLCGNPRHLELGTHQDNMDDKVERNRQARMPGERNPQHKLTACEVLEIRREQRNGTSSRRDLAERFNVSLASIDLIVTRKRWGWLDEGAVIIEDGEVAA